MSFWICTNDTAKASHFYTFEKSFSIQSNATLTANVSADMRYQLFVNETLACEGPCQGPQYVRYYETVDLTPYLVAGENTVRARVMYTDEETLISVFRMGRPAFWFDGTVTEGGQTRAIGTDKTWSCYREDGIHLYRHGYLSLPPMEEHFAQACDTPMEVSEMYEPDLTRQGFNPYGLNETYILSPRPIPPMKTHAPRAMKIVRRGDGFIELDAGCYTTAKIALSLRATSVDTLRVIYSEAYAKRSETDPNRAKKEVRDDASDSNSILTGIFDQLHTTKDVQHFKPFWYRSFRFIRIEYSPKTELELIDATYAPYFYPLDEDGSFECSDERLNEMWRVSRNTVLCCMHEMYVDCPFYEQQQYDMDSALEMLYTFRMGSDTRMPLKSLNDLAHSQLPDGLLQANYPSTHVQVIPDFTLFWVMMARDYLRYTKDASSVKALLGTIDKALCAFETLKNNDGLISPTRYWHFVDWVPGWERGVPPKGDEEPLTVTCLMYATALRAAAEICHTLKNDFRAAEYSARAEEMIEAVKRHCYAASVGLYRDTPSSRTFAQHTTLWAILSGAEVGARAGELLDRTFHSTEKIAECTFSMNHYLFRALELADRYRYAPRLFEGWQKMLDLHCTTWCENPDDPRSECHGWSSAPAYEFSAMTLGVYPIEDGYTAVRVKPDFETHNLTFARGTVPTPRGIISVAWEKIGTETLLSVTLPSESMHAEIHLPTGIVKQTAKTASYRF